MIVYPSIQWANGVQMEGNVQTMSSEAALTMEHA